MYPVCGGMVCPSIALKENMVRQESLTLRNFMTKPQPAFDMSSEAVFNNNTLLECNITGCTCRSPFLSVRITN